MTALDTAFAPICNEQSRILILGSFPSVKSRQVGFYYGNPRNRFWRVLEHVFSDSVGDNATSKTNFLLRHYIALWDVVARAAIKGSGDDTLTKYVRENGGVEDIASLCNRLPNLTRIACNGATSYNLLIANVRNTVVENAQYSLVCANGKIPIIKLPSTSMRNRFFDIELWKDALQN